VLFAFDRHQHLLFTPADAFFGFLAAFFGTRVPAAAPPTLLRSVKVTKDIGSQFFEAVPRAFVVAG
jgi:hypothetical protein